MGALLLDGAHPGRVLARTREPLFVPKTEYEKNGFFSDTVFPCAAWVEHGGNGDVVPVYYGAADKSVCRAVIPLDSIREGLKA